MICCSTSAAVGNFGSIWRVCSVLHCYINLLSYLLLQVIFAWFSVASAMWWIVFQFLFIYLIAFLFHEISVKTDLLYRNCKQDEVILM